MCSLFRIRAGNYFGLINRNGDIIVPPIFVGIGDISKEGIVVTLDGIAYGVIDQTGAFRVPPRYRNLGSGYSCGLLAARLDNDFGYIDGTGDGVIDFKYHAASHFFENRAAVKIKHSYGFIDLCGFQITPCVYERVRFFKCARAAFEVDNKLGFFDLDGSIVIPPMFEAMSTNNFSENIASVAIKTKFGIIDEFGKYLVKPQFRFIGGAANGMSRFQVESQKFGYMDLDGNVVIEPEFFAATDFSDERALVQSGKMWQIIDKSCNIIAEVRCDLASNLVNGYALIEIRDKVGLINANGQLIIPPIYDFIGPVNDELAEFRLASLCGYINMSGREVWSSVVTDN